MAPEIPCSSMYALSPAKDKDNPTSSVLSIIDDLSKALNFAICEIREINENAKLLSLNARIEAARAGSSGAAFGVVAHEMQSLSEKTAGVADEMANQTTSTISNLLDFIGGNVRGTRLADLALSNIDLVDRNLYERTCDVRWWATDAAIVQALISQSEEDFRFASERMGLILNAYTVYHDLVLCDLNGTVVANGRPQTYRLKGRKEAKSYWLTSALKLASGDHFVCQPPHDSELVPGEKVAIYATAVRERGLSNGRPIGVLAVVFNWQSLANAILNSSVFDQETWRMFVDGSGNVLAASPNVPPNFRFPVQRYEQVFKMPRGYVVDQFEGKDVCIAHALSPGFETYSTGWHSVLIQPLY
ncbi:methyl-accepting chemotaxis protein [Pirellulaceae bacterium SH449]